MEIVSKIKVMDKEWVELIMEARDLGLSPSEIKEFFQRGKEEEVFNHEKKEEP